MDGGASRSCTRAPLFLGGPVGLDAVTALHRDAHFGRVVAGAVRTAAFAETMRRLEGGELRADACRLFCGYSGWAPRQLQHEVDVGVWLPCSASDALLMGFSDAAAPTLGARLLRLMGGRFADIAARQPGDDKLL
ncbi:hypothetical protein BWQ96_01717 [Gracilariopsis chorda]|uniref:Uncharacterized protein n=1 Tax=Gracilariopsis chorda TaxID=448386 RepID=A0A2V3J2C6_9FLOR|nr:hypothetical protein BWQ96_01717 [Gracilariopsis chorda]|eukprot:PXF48548.1 hypothetical protein BWQ96_01717 [Gracilariopsis chorda]